LPTTSSVASFESEENNFKCKFSSGDSQDRRITYVRLFPSWHTESPCGRGRNLGRSPVLYGVKRIDFARVPQTNHAGQRVARRGQEVLCRGTRGLCGMRSRRSEAHGSWHSAAASGGPLLERR